MTQPDGRADSRRERPKGRRARRIFVVLFVLLALLVGADFAFAAVAEHAISQKAREQLKLSEDPSVQIHSVLPDWLGSFPFTPQALSGDYTHITVSAGGVPVQDKLRDVELQAELRDVTAPLSDLTSGNTGAIKIGSIEGQVRVKASDLARISPLDKVEDLKIEPSTEEYVKTGQDTKTDAEKEQDAKADKSAAAIRLSGYVQVAGQKIEIFCFAMIELDGAKVHISPQRLQFGNDKETTVVPQEVQKAVLPNFEATIDAGDLPFKVTPTAVRVDMGSVTLKGKAEDVTFSGVTSGK